MEKTIEILFGKRKTLNRIFMFEIFPNAMPESNINVVYFWHLDQFSCTLAWPASYNRIYRIQ